MQTVITKNAQKVIDTFSKRELGVFDLGIDYIKQDIEHINKCQKEIEVYENKDPERYRTAITHQLNMTFRAKYLLQCLGLYVYDFHDTETIEVKTIKDK